MQISFLKDLATLRDPQSKFTFINYLKAKDRLVSFVNLSTFLPLREEFNDYLTWCASHFEPLVRYGKETIAVSPKRGSQGRVEAWQVFHRDMRTNEESSITARHVVIAVGGAPNIPDVLSHLASDSNIFHSSSYATMTRKLSERVEQVKNVAVIGGGQSAAEIFNDLQSRFGDTAVTLYTSAPALKSSDDSPL